MEQDESYPRNDPANRKHVSDATKCVCRDSRLGNPLTPNGCPYMRDAPRPSYGEHAAFTRE